MHPDLYSSKGRSQQGHKGSRQRPHASQFKVPGGNRGKEEAQSLKGHPRQSGVWPRPFAATKPRSSRSGTGCFSVGAGVLPQGQSAPSWRHGGRRQHWKPRPNKDHVPALIAVCICTFCHSDPLLDGRLKKIGEEMLPKNPLGHTAMRLHRRVVFNMGL